MRVRLADVKLETTWPSSPLELPIVSADAACLRVALTDRKALGGQVRCNCCHR